MLPNAVPKPVRAPKPPRQFNSTLPVSTKPIARSRLHRRPISKEESARQYGSKLFRDYLHATPCLGCGQTEYIAQAHFGKHPMGKKNDWTKTGPLCEYSAPGTAPCHDRWDRREVPKGVSWFTEAERALILQRLAAFQSAWQSKGGTHKQKVAK